MMAGLSTSGSSLLPGTSVHSITLKLQTVEAAKEYR